MWNLEILGLVIIKIFKTDSFTLKYVTILVTFFLPRKYFKNTKDFG